MSDIYDNVIDFGGVANRSFATAFNVLNEMAETRKQEVLQRIMLPLTVKKAQAEIASIEMLGKQREAQLDLVKARADELRSNYEGDAQLQDWTSFGATPSDEDSGDFTQPVDVIPELPAWESQDDPSSNPLTPMGEDAPGASPLEGFDNVDVVPEKTTAAIGDGSGELKIPAQTKVVNRGFDVPEKLSLNPEGASVFDGLPDTDSEAAPAPQPAEPATEKKATAVSTPEEEINHLLSEKDAILKRAADYSSYLSRSPGTPQKKSSLWTRAYQSAQSQVRALDTRIDLLKSKLPSGKAATEDPETKNAYVVRDVAKAMVDAGDVEGAQRLLSKVAARVGGGDETDSPLAKIEQETGFKASQWKESLRAERALESALRTKATSIPDPTDATGKRRLTRDEATALYEQTRSDRTIFEAGAPVFVVPKDQAAAQAKKKEILDFASRPGAEGLPIIVRGQDTEATYFVASGKLVKGSDQPSGTKDKNVLSDDLPALVQQKLDAQKAEAGKASASRVASQIKDLETQIAEYSDPARWQGNRYRDDKELGAVNSSPAGLLMPRGRGLPTFLTADEVANRIRRLQQRIARLKDEGNETASAEK